MTLQRITVNSEIFGGKAMYSLHAFSRFSPSWFAGDRGNPEAILKVYPLSRMLLISNLSFWLHSKKAGINPTTTFVTVCRMPSA